VNIRVDTGVNGVTVEQVTTLYEEYARMDVPAYYEEYGGENPFAGRCRVIPFKATYYTLVPERDLETLMIARLIMNKIGKRRKVYEVACEKHEINFNQFTHTGRIVVLYV
jgi:hypothetical protein